MTPEELKKWQDEQQVIREKSLREDREEISAILKGVNYERTLAYNYEAKLAELNTKLNEIKQSPEHSLLEISNTLKEINENLKNLTQKL